MEPCAVVEHVGLEGIESEVAFRAIRDGVVCVERVVMGVKGGDAELHAVYGCHGGVGGIGCEGKECHSGRTLAVTRGWVSS
jgi:hypothetical protein